MLIPEIASRFGRSVLLVTGSTSFAASPTADRLMNAITEEGMLQYQVRIVTEPSPQDIDEVVHDFKNKYIDVVVAIGGGSVIDAGKAISAMLPVGEEVKKYLEGVGFKEHTGEKIPFIAVPTTSGTGSEATKNAVLSDVGPGGYKKSLRHDNFIPEMAVIDPELIMGCPPEITTTSGMDAFTQLAESFLSTNSNAFTDALALEGIRRVANSLEKAWRQGGDLQARSDMALAAMLSGVTLTNAGLGVIHGFASSLGGRYEIPHGVVCGTFMGTVNRLMLEKVLREEKYPVILDKYVQISRIFFPGRRDANKRDMAVRLIDKIDEMVDKMNIPRLSRFGITSNDLEEIAGCTSNKNNPVAFDRDDMIMILESRL